ncbi:MAG: hybrid sensor histidine kinase/response regulator, partial [Armatimonadetes bacterium]
MEPFLKQQNDFLRMIMTVVLLTIAGSVLIGSVVQRLISRPIVKLLTTLKSVGESGDYSVRLESKNNDELGQLIHQFNRTIQEVERRDAELYRDKQSLESRVRQRTVELEREIVERERMQEELRQSTARLQDFIDNAPVGIKWLGPDGTIQDANLAELNIVKLDRESYLGKKFRMYF